MVKEIPSGLPQVRLRAVSQADACRVSAIISEPGKEREVFLADVPVAGVKLALRQYVKQVNDAPRGNQQKLDDKKRRIVPQEIKDLLKLKKASAIADAAWEIYYELEDEEFVCKADELGIDLSPVEVTA